MPNLHHSADLYGHYSVSDLNEHLTCNFFVKWAQAVDFPHAFSVEDTAVVAAALHSWPHSFRKEVAILALGWVLPGAGAPMEPGLVKIIGALARDGLGE